jgi:L-ascorbate metabolism protein UlaG (beta-lactamase superfamily)
VEDNPNSKGIAVTQDEIIEMARQAKAIPMHKDFNQLALIGTENIETFAKLVAEREREACAKIADEWAVGWPHPSQSIAEWIRKRT